MSRKILISAVVVLALALSAYYYAGSRKGQASLPTGLTSGNQPDKLQAPGIQQEETAEPPTIEIDSDRQRLLGAKTVEVLHHDLRKTIRTTGRVEVDERRVATLNSKFEGWIEKLHADYTGRFVKKGEAVAEIFSPELVATQQEYLNALKWQKQNNTSENDRMRSMLSRDASALAEASAQRLRLWDITEEQIRKIEEAGKPLRTLVMYSPVNGYIIQKMAFRGMRVMPGEKLFDIADLSSVWIIADIYESELSLIRPGQHARLQFANMPGSEIDSAVEFVSPSLSADTRTAKVRFTVPNKGNSLKPQMFINVEVRVSLGSRLSVPTDAVLDTGIRQVVYVDRGEGLFEPREVRTGLRTDDMVEVVSGLKKGEKIAASAIFLIDSEAQLKGVKPLSEKKQ